VGDAPALLALVRSEQAVVDCIPDLYHGARHTLPEPGLVANLFQEGDIGDKDDLMTQYIDLEDGAYIESSVERLDTIPSAQLTILSSQLVQRSPGIVRIDIEHIAQNGNTGRRGDLSRHGDGDITILYNKTKQYKQGRGKKDRASSHTEAGEEQLKKSSYLLANPQLGPIDRSHRSRSLDPGEKWRLSSLHRSTQVRSS